MQQLAEYQLQLVDSTQICQTPKPVILPLQLYHSSLTSIRLSQSGSQANSQSLSMYSDAYVFKLS